MRIDRSTIQSDSRLFALSGTGRGGGGSARGGSGPQGCEGCLGRIRGWLFLSRFWEPAWLPVLHARDLDLTRAFRAARGVRVLCAGSAPSHGGPVTFLPLPPHQSSRLQTVFVFCCFSFVCWYFLLFVCFFKLWLFSSVTGKQSSAARLTPHPASDAQ